MSDHVQPVAVAEDKTMAVVVYVLFLLSFVTMGVTGLVGVILAYANRSVAGPRMASHHTFQIRTFWIGFAAMLFGATLFFWGAIFSLILIGIPFLIMGKLLLAATTVWYAVRCVVGLIKASQDDAYPTPHNWLL